MTENTNPAATLDSELPLRTAGSLPSSRTEGLLRDALESDDINVVKENLVHTWLHYQSLEFGLNRIAQPEGIEYIKTTIADELPDADPVTAAIRALAGPVLESSYDTAHQAGFFMSVMGLEPSEALRTIYTELDHSDPDRELSEAQLTELSGQAADEEDGE